MCLLQQKGAGKQLHRRLLPRVILITCSPQMTNFCFRNRRESDFFCLKLHIDKISSFLSSFIITTEYTFFVVVAETHSCSKIHFLVHEYSHWTTFPRIPCSKVWPCDWVFVKGHERDMFHFRVWPAKPSRVPSSMSFPPLDDWDCEAEKRKCRWPRGTWKDAQHG